MRRGHVVLALLVLHLASACVIRAPVGTRDLGPPPAEALRDQLGTVGLRMNTTAPSGFFDAPTAGKIRGLKKGFGMGAEAWADSGQSLSGGGLFYLLTLPVFMVVGAVTGLVRAPSQAAVTAAEESLVAALARHDVPAEFEPWFVRAMQERVDAPFVLLAPGEERPAEVDVILQIGIESVSLSARGLDPTMPLRVRCRARLLDPEVGTLFEAALDFAWTRHDFLGWGANDGAALHDELALSYSFLAEGIVEELFLVHVPLPPKETE